MHCNLLLNQSLGDGVVYAVTAMAWDPATKLANMKAQIVDVKSGKELCSKEFSYSSSGSPSSRSFGLLGSERRLAYCGGDSQGKCYQLDPKEDGREEFISEAGPQLTNHASVISKDHKKWLLVREK